jgi:hypothetical protein
MHLTRTAPIVLLLTLTLALGGIGGAAARAADHSPTTTVVQTSVRDDRSAPITVLLVGVGAVVGVIVGVIPALLVAVLLGYVPPPRAGRRRSGLLVEPLRAPPRDAAGAVPIAPVTEAAPVVAARAAETTDEVPPPPLAILAHARHQAVYDAAYAEETERVEALRATIGGRLRARPEPPSE